MNKNTCLIFDYDNGNTQKYSTFNHTEGFTHHTSPPISLQVIKTHLEIDHVNKPSCSEHLSAIAI